MSKNLQETCLFLPKKDPDLVRATSDWSETEAYWVVDRRPKVSEWYINLYVTQNERSIQRYRSLRQLRNAQKDYRFKHCCVVVRTSNINIKIQ